MCLLLRLLGGPWNFWNLASVPQPFLFLAFLFVKIFFFPTAGFLAKVFFLSVVILSFIWRLSVSFFFSGPTNVVGPPPGGWRNFCLYSEPPLGPRSLFSGPSGLLQPVGDTGLFPHRRRLGPSDEFRNRPIPVLVPSWDSPGPVPILFGYESILGWKNRWPLSGCFMNVFFFPPPI